MSLLDFMGMANNPEVQAQVAKFMQLGETVANLADRLDAIAERVNEVQARVDALYRLALEERRLKGIDLPVPTTAQQSTYLNRIMDGNI